MFDKVSAEQMWGSLDSQRNLRTYCRTWGSTAQEHALGPLCLPAALPIHINLIWPYIVQVLLCSRPIHVCKKAPDLAPTLASNTSPAREFQAPTFLCANNWPHRSPLIFPLTAFNLVLSSTCHFHSGEINRLYDCLPSPFS